MKAIRNHKKSKKKANFVWLYFFYEINYKNLT